MIAYSADKIFTGTNWLLHHTLLVEDGRISDILPTESVPSTIRVQHHSDCFIAPAFIDLQIYGALGKLLSVHPTEETLQRMLAYCMKGGAKLFLPTVATNTGEIFYKCIDAVKNYWQNDGKGVAGLHIEGPWINKEKRGAHIENLIHSPGLEEVRELLEYGKTVIKMITLAPEVCTRDVVTLIQSYNIIVSAGHSNATYKEATNAFDDGITMATHLFNAMSPLQHREPGMAGAILNHPSVMSSIIPDGYHVDFAAIRIAKKLMQERLFIITDAVTETHEGAYPHQLDGDKYTSNGILSGSALTMALGVKKCVHQVGIPLDEALRMAGLYPARVIGLDDQTGKLEKGYKADLVVLNKELDVVQLV